MRPQIELRHLWYFVSIADEQGFTRAAKKIGIAQPPLSQQIQRLEDIVGTPLFDRSGRRTKLTEAGARFLPDARRILADADQTLQTVRRLGSGELGTLTVGFWPSTLFSPLPAAVRRFRELSPGIRVRLREITPTGHVEGLRAGTLDLAVVREPEHEPDISEHAVVVEPFVAVVPADHPLAARKSIAVRALRDEPFVLFPREGHQGLHARLMTLCRRAAFEPRVVQEVEAWHTIVSLVEAGLGVSLIPASFVGRRGGALAYLPLSGRQVTTTTMACVRATGRRPSVDAFLELLVARSKP
jgi:DNA-binding transcriptional LysR family regulator